MVIGSGFRLFLRVQAIRGALGTGLLYCVERFGWVYRGTWMGRFALLSFFGFFPSLFKNTWKRALDSRF